MSLQRFGLKVFAAVLLALGAWLAGGGVWLYQRVEGIDIPIRAVRPSSMKPAGEAVRFRVAASGSQILVTLDGETAVQAVDTAPRSGKPRPGRRTS